MFLYHLSLQRPTGIAQAVVVNSGNANAATGERGLAAARERALHSEWYAEEGRYREATADERAARLAERRIFTEGGE